MPHYLNRPRVPFWLPFSRAHIPFPICPLRSTGSPCVVRDRAPDPVARDHLAIPVSHLGLLLLPLAPHGTACESQERPCCSLPWNRGASAEKCILGVSPTTVFKGPGRAGSACEVGFPPQQRKESQSLAAPGRVRPAGCTVMMLSRRPVRFQMPFCLCPSRVRMLGAITRNLVL